MENNNKKRNKLHLALNCAIGTLALLGSVGTITFGTLWCKARNNGGGDAPQAGEAIEWEGEVASKVESGTQGEQIVWDFTNRDTYRSPIEPKAEKTFSTTDEAKNEYFDAVLNNHLIFTNDTIRNMMNNFLYTDLFEYGGTSSDNTLFHCPNEIIDEYYSLSGYEEYTTNDFVGTANLYSRTDDIKKDDVHNCLRITNTSLFKLYFSYSLYDEGAWLRTEYGYYDVEIVAKDFPFTINYDDAHMIDQKTWFSNEPNDFVDSILPWLTKQDNNLNDNEDYWAFDDEDWSLSIINNEFAFVEDGTTMTMICDNLPQICSGFYNSEKLKIGDIYPTLLSIADQFCGFAPNNVDNGIYYLKNCSVSA